MLNEIKNKFNKLLKKLRKEFRARLNDGCFCPVCDKYAKNNKVSVTGGMVNALRWIAKQDGWVYVQDHGDRKVLRSNSHAKFKHWGMIKRKDGESGVRYKVTKKGKRFLAGKIKVTKYVRIYNDKVVERSTEKIYVHEVKSYKRKIKK